VGRHFPFLPAVMCFHAIPITLGYQGSKIGCVLRPMKDLRPVELGRGKVQKTRSCGFVSCWLGPVAKLLIFI
jgi:hypothetical protein